VNQQVIGILGGMGPAATQHCLQAIVAGTYARTDQDHLHVIVDSNPKTPDRTSAILGTGPSPVPAMIQSVRRLAGAGADFLIIPCVSAHAFLDEVSAQTDVPILSMLDAVADAVVEARPYVHTVGLLATTGTIARGMFQRRLAREQLTTCVPAPHSQAQVMSAIYDIKAQPTRDVRGAATRRFVAAADELVAHGAQAIIAGCTEIPLALNQGDLGTPLFDAVEILARAAIRRAGGRLVPARARDERSAVCSVDM